MGEGLEDSEIFTRLKEVEPNYQKLATQAQEIYDGHKHIQSSAVEIFSQGKGSAEVERINRRVFWARTGGAIGGALLFGAGAVTNSLIDDSPPMDSLKEKIWGVEFDLSEYMAEILTKRRNKPEFSDLAARAGRKDERIERVLKCVAKFDNSEYLSARDFDAITEIRDQARNDLTHAFLTGVLVDAQTRDRVSPKTLDFFNREYEVLPSFLRGGIVQKKISTLISTVEAGNEKDSKQWNLGQILPNFNEHIGPRLGISVSEGSNPTLDLGPSIVNESLIYEQLVESQTSEFYAFLHMVQFVAAHPDANQHQRREVWGNFLLHLKIVAKVAQIRGLAFEKAIWNAASVMATQAYTFGDLMYFSEFMEICLPTEQTFWHDPGGILLMTERRAGDLDNMVIGFALTLFASRREKYRALWESSTHPLGLKSLHARMHTIRQLEYAKKVSVASKVAGLTPQSDQSLTGHLIGERAYALYAPAVGDIIGRDW